MNTDYTNREWLQSLDDYELANLICKTISKAVFEDKTLSVNSVFNWLNKRHTDRQKGE